MSIHQIKSTILFVAGLALSANTFATEESDAKNTVTPERTSAVETVNETSAFDAFLDSDKPFGGKFSTWVEFASDYVFRGESETNDGKIPSLKASVTWTHDSGVYLGLYMANNLFPGGNTEGNNSKINSIYGPYIGYSTKNIADTGINYNGFLFQYIYPGDSDSNYLEMFNYIDKQYGKVNLKLEYSPTITDWFGVKGLQSHNIAIHPSIALPHGFNLSGSLGYQFFSNSGPNLDANGNGKEELDWAHWNIGVSRNVFGFSTNHQIVDSRFVIGVSKSF
jgi:uncharacterized protein (TIGR02001 family)